MIKTKKVNKNIRSITNKKIFSNKAPSDKEIKDKHTNDFKAVFEKARKLVEDRRKQGYDTYISELLLSYGPSYTQMYAASGTRNDYDQCVLLLKNIELESHIEELKFTYESSE